MWRSALLLVTYSLACTALPLPLSSDVGLAKINRPPPSSWTRTQCGSPSGDADLLTPFGEAVSADPAHPPLPEYPRPMLVRVAAESLENVDRLRAGGDPATWISLNGLWEWEPTDEGPPPFGRTLNSSILVPFPVESCLSGVAPKSSKDQVKRMWYRLRFTPAAKMNDGERLVLHFGAVDWQTVVYCNGKLVANHTGGYDGFDADLTPALHRNGGESELIVGVYDQAIPGFGPTMPSSLNRPQPQPNGKQRISAIDAPGGDTYTPSSGIWQPVWLERVPAASVDSLRINVRDVTGTNHITSINQ